MVSLTKEELGEEFETQIKFLIGQCDRFDKGDINEAKHIAVTLRKLLHDPGRGKSKSLLGQIDRKAVFLDTALIFNIRNINTSECYLVHSLMQNPKHQWKPIFDDNHNSNLINFSEWWGSSVIKDLEGKIFSRERLVDVFANQDGGAHVDSDIDDDFYNLTRKNSVQRFTQQVSGGDFPEKINIQELKPIKSPAYYTIRQIAHEVLRSLNKKYFPDVSAYSGGSFSVIGFE